MLECKAAALVKLEDLCGRHGIRMPTVSYDLRGRDAGEAYVELNHINFNVVLAMENFQDFIDNTVPHELAHVWQTQLKLGGYPHGREWKGLMKRLGAAPTRCHNLQTDASESRTGYFLYRCPCRPGNMVTLEMHRRMQQDPNAYRCDRCRLPFRYVPPAPGRPPRQSGVYWKG